MSLTKSATIAFRLKINFIAVVTAIIESSAVNKINFVIMSTRFISAAINIRCMTLKFKKILK